MQEFPRCCGNEGEEQRMTNLKALPRGQSEVDGGDVECTVWEVRGEGVPDVNA